MALVTPTLTLVITQILWSLHSPRILCPFGPTSLCFFVFFFFFPFTYLSFPGLPAFMTALLCILLGVFLAYLCTLSSLNLSLSLQPLFLIQLALAFSFPFRPFPIQYLADSTPLFLARPLWTLRHWPPPCGLSRARRLRHEPHLGPGVPGPPAWPLCFLSPLSVPQSFLANR